MAVLDQWLDHIDTETVLPLFDGSDKPYATRKLSDVAKHGTAIEDLASRIAKGESLSILQNICSLSGVQQVLELLHSCNEYQHLHAVYIELLRLVDMKENFLLLDDAGHTREAQFELLHVLVCFLQRVPCLITALFSSESWTSHKESLLETISAHGPILLKELLLAANSFGYAIRQPFALLLQNLPRLSIGHVSEVLELLSLSVADVKLAIELIVECLQPELARLLADSAVDVEHLAKSYAGIALNHIDVVSCKTMPNTPPLHLKLDGFDKHGNQMAKFVPRIDSNVLFQVGDHIRLRPTVAPRNAPHMGQNAIDARLIGCNHDECTLRCLHHLPSYAEDCLWKLVGHESFVTTKAMFDAVLTFHSQKSNCCSLYPVFLGFSIDHTDHGDAKTLFEPRSTLNESQNRAVGIAMAHACTLIRTPPGTGKMRTIISVVNQFQIQFPYARILVTAPTHMAVDKMLKRYVADWQQTTKDRAAPLRITTRVCSIQHKRHLACANLLILAAQGRCGSSTIHLRGLDWT